MKLIVSAFLMTCIIIPTKFAFAIESHAVVLMYHRFGEDKFPSTNIKTEQFILQLDFIAENGFTVWPLPKIISHLQSKTPIPDKTIAITIDDAYQSVYQVAYPLMLDRNIPFTLFVASGVVDKGYAAYMDWAQIKDMSVHGVTLGNHSLNHFHLVEGKDTILSEVLSEVLANQRRMIEMTGIKPNLFAYPYGEFDIEITEKIKIVDYVGFGQHSGPIGENSDFRSLPRFPVSEQYADMNALKDKLYSLPMPIAEVKPEKTITSLTRPLMLVTLRQSIREKQSLQCFVSGQGAANVRWLSDRKFSVQAKKPIVIRRSRYNCTIKDSKTGRFFWYSHMWLRPEISEP